LVVAKLNADARHAETFQVADAITLRYRATCAQCAAEMSGGTRARWDRATKSATCLSCEPEGDAESKQATPSEDQDHRFTPAEEPLDGGVAGASARRIADRQTERRAKAKEQRDEATWAAHPKVGGLLVKVRDALAEPEKTTSWQKGAAGEEAVGRRFAALAEEGFAVLHDRRKPGTRWNIDHLVVGPRGVYVIDAKHFSGPLEVRSTGSFLRPGPNRVFVNGRHQDKRVAAMDWQVECVGAAVGARVEELGGVIRPVLCFVGVEVGLLQGPWLAGEREVLITWPRRFVKDVGRDGPLGSEQIAEVARRLDQALPKA
jgi:hypothetical protein